MALAAKGQDSKKLLLPSFSSNVHPGEGGEKRNLVSLPLKCATMFLSEGWRQ